MVELRRFGLADTLLFLLVLAAAAGARGWYLTAHADSGNGPGPLRVQDARPTPAYPEGTVMRGRAAPTELDALVHHLKEDRSFISRAPLAAGEERTAHVAPGYPVLLALVESSPVDLGPADRTTRWLHCILGTLTAGCYFLFARRVFRSLAVATVTGLACAFHPFWVVNTAQVDDGVVAGFLLGAALALGARAGDAGGPLASWLYGLCLAGLALVRAACLPFAFAAVLWFLWRSRTLPRGWLAAFLAFLGFVTGLLPWTVQNARQLQDVIPVVDSAYLHFWIGNNPAATSGPLAETTLRQVLEKQSAITLEELERLPQPERYRKLMPLALREIGNDPAAALYRRLRAGLCFFLGEQWLLTGEPWQKTDAEAPLPDGFAQALHGSLLVMLVLGFLGWRWTAAWRREAMPSSLALMWIPLPYLLSHAEALAGPRLPLDGVLLCYAAFAVCGMLPLGNLLQGSAASAQPE